MKRPSFTVIISGIFVAYFAHSIWVIYTMFFPKECQHTSNCLRPFLARNPKLELRVYTSLKSTVRSSKELNLIWKHEQFSVSEKAESEFNISIPLKTRKNGTLYAHVFVHPHDKDPFLNSEYHVHASAPMTQYAVPESKTFNLLQDSKEQEKTTQNPSQPVTHWRPSLTISIMEDKIAFDPYALPGELYRLMRFTNEREYLPLLYLDELSNRLRDLYPINKSSTTLPLKITYSPISVGKLRLWVNMQESMKQLHSLGFTEKDTDEMKGIFADTNMYFLLMTFAVAALHLLFDFLAFKNDISYWKERKDMIGLSTRMVVFRCVSTIIIFLYLLDSNTSLLVLIPSGIGAVIEVWKMKKAFKISVHWSGLRPHFKLGTTSDREKETQEFDSQAMKYLSYVMYPLCLGGAVYSLLYTPHKGWYSWCIQSLVNGIYAFGFMFMLPQLFVNYKLKSVAHLPWRAFMYKAFNTFIDDVFAFIITMPTAHRLACFRDDVVFLIYLYQRWLYPVDKTRVNEFGQTFEEKDAVEKKKQ